MKEIVLAGAVRTPIGKMGGSLANVSAAELGAIVIKETLKRSGVPANAVDEVLMGCVLQAAQGQNVARQAAISAGLPNEVPALTLNNVCGSGLKCVNLAAAMIQAGQAEIVVAGGMENMSRAVYALQDARYGYRMSDGKLIDTMIRDSLWDAFHDYHMGITAENLARQYAISREMQDEFSAMSQQKCERARSENRFADEIVPVPVKVRKDTVLFERDEYPRDGVTKENLASLKPAFLADGTVTAGNASTLNDGAGAVVMASAEKAKELGLKPLARLVSYGHAGVEPEYMGIGPVPASRNALAKAGLTVADMDLIEANEAFAAQACAVAKELGLDNEKVNPNGSGISLGHPVGGTGAILVTKAIYELQRTGGRYALITMCIGGGQGIAMVIERL